MKDRRKPYLELTAESNGRRLNSIVRVPAAEKNDNMRKVRNQENVPDTPAACSRSRIPRISRRENLMQLRRAEHCFK